MTLAAIFVNLNAVEPETIIFNFLQNKNTENQSGSHSSISSLFYAALQQKLKDEKTLYAFLTSVVSVNHII